jgi:hypothetical protein
MRALFIMLARRYIEKRERELGRPLTEGERNRVALLFASPLLLFALFCFYMAWR